MVTQKHDIKAIDLTWTFTEGQVCDLTTKRMSPTV